MSTTKTTHAKTTQPSAPQPKQTKPTTAVAATPAVTPRPAGTAAGGSTPGTASPPAPVASPPSNGAGTTAASTGTPAPGPGASPPAPSNVRFVDIPLDDFTQIATQVTAFVSQIRTLVVNPTRYTPDQRMHSAGRLKDGEGPMLQKVLDVAAAYPASFESLANLDFGEDPSTFEVGLVGDRLAKAAILGPLVDLLNALVQDLSDSTLELNGTGRQPASEAYVIAKALAKTNPIINGMIADVIGYYAAVAKAAAATRKANKAAAAAAPASPSPQPAPAAGAVASAT